jgi:hypothetical protein
VWLEYAATLLRKKGEKGTYNLLVRIISTPFPPLSYATMHILVLLELLHEKEKNSHSIHALFYLM